jgi:L-ornithine N5-oxygenase
MQIVKEAGMEIYDFIGIGFGPANLSVIVAMEESGLLDNDLNVTFIESKPEFTWHSGMLLPDAEMQISFLKDLVMLRNPTSKYTFLNYLSEKGRLELFANLTRFYPRRIEYNDYLKWAAEQFDDYVKYSERVLKIEPVKNPNDGVELLAVHKENSLTGKKTTLYARNISLATGISKKMPENVGASSTDIVAHSSDFLDRLESSFKDRDADYDFVVVGSGQSATEITMHLANEYKNSKVKLCIRSYALKPSDETEFVNEIFNSEQTIEFFKYSDELKKKVVASHRDTNYSATDPELISSLYERLYCQRVTGDEQIQINHFYELDDIDQERQIAKFNDLKYETKHELPFDGMFLATGYELRMIELLCGFEDYLKYDSSGRLVLDENYSVEAKANNFSPKLFVQGASEHSHGLSETLLSLLAYRSEKITAQFATKKACAKN